MDVKVNALSQWFSRPARAPVGIEQRVSYCRITAAWPQACASAWGSFLTEGLTRLAGRIRNPSHKAEWTGHGRSKRDYRGGRTTPYACFCAYWSLRP
jgi:hypothetical protein